MSLKKIFFSYSRVDASEFTLKLALDLKNAGFNIWIDQLDIRAGKEWDLEIEKALETCDCLLFIESAKSVTSNNVLDEVYYALEQKKRVIPVIYHDSKTPFRIQRLQHIDFSKNYDTGLANLTTELKRGAVNQVLLQEKETLLTVPGTNFFRKYIVLLSVLATTLLFAVAWLILNSSKKEKVAATVHDIRVTKNDTATNNQSADLTKEAAIVKTENTNPQRKPDKKRPAEKITAVTDQPLANLAENFAGNWVLASVTPKVRLHRGYLKIEALDEKKVKLLSNIQFYYFKTNDTNYLSVFNAFASCNSCGLQHGMKITERDIAIGSNKFVILNADGPDGKAGDTVMSGGGNNTITAYASLYLKDQNTIIIKIEQPKPTPVDNDLTVPPFIYNFSFKRND